MSRRHTVAVVASLLLLLIPVSCTRDTSPSPPFLRERVTICTGGNIQLLPLVAETKGFFAESGVDGVVINLGDGKKAIDSLLAGDCTFGLLADPPVVAAASRRSDFAIVASTSSSESSVRITARRDRGIQRVTDLKGKRIGVKRGVNSEAFAAALLERYRIGKGDVSIVPLDLKEMPGALAAGEIDAFSSSPTMLIEALRLLGERAIILTEPGIYFNSNHLLVRRDFLPTGGETIRKTLSALAAAEDFLRANPAEGRRILASRARISEAEAEELLKGETVALRLSPDQLRSLRQNQQILLRQGTITPPLPDLSTFIEPGPLRSVRPSAVTIGGEKKP